jgi:hydrogenase-4 component E
MDALFSRLTMIAASAMLLTSLVVLWRKHVSAYISAFRWQSVTLALTGMLVAWRGGVHELFAVSALILLLKGLGVPWILRRMEARFPAQQELRPLVNTETSMLVAGGLSIAAYFVSRPVTAVISLPTRGGLPLALALVLVSLFIVISRRTALSQIVGFLMLENGVALIALLGAYGVPFVVELGVFLDVLLGVLVMQVLVYQIQETFNTVDVEQLNRLRH